MRRYLNRASYKELLLLIASILLSLLLAEAILSRSRMFDREPNYGVNEHENRPNKDFVVDAVTGWKMRPLHEFSWPSQEWHGTYRSNRQGFRAQADVDAAETRKKIVVAGDSFTFGTGVDNEETYGALIEAALPGSVVYNLGMPGFGLDQLWLSVRHQGLPLQPDLVIVGFVDSDFERSLTAYRTTEGYNKPAFKLVNGRLVPKSDKDHPSAITRFLERNSRVWRARRLILRQLGYYIPIGEWWLLNRAILDQIQVDCRAHQVPVVFVYIPTKAWRSFPLLRTYMQRTGAHYISLRDNIPSFPQDLYFLHDGHTNAKGHAYIADTLLRWIRENFPEITQGAAIK